MNAMQFREGTYELVEGPAGEGLGAVVQAAQGPGWWPLDDRLNVLKGCRQPLGKNEAREAVLDEWMLEAMGQQPLPGMGTPRTKPIKAKAPHPVQMEAVQSSCIKAIGYRPDDETVLVEFKSGGIFSYPNVKRVTFTRFLKAPSKGRFFHRHIRGGKFGR